MTAVGRLRYAQLGWPALARSRARTVAALLLLIAGFLGSVVLLVVAMIATGAVDLLGAGGQTVLKPVELVAALLVVPIVTLPSAVLTARWILRLSPRQVCSVTGRFRWWFYRRCLIVAASVFVMSTALSTLWTGVTLGPPPGNWPLLLLIVVCCVPLQAFAEEFVFRGVLTHILGARWARPVWAVAVPAVGTSVVFSLSHGPTGIAHFVALAVGGVAYSVLCDRTGGLEASSAVHAAWNATLMLSIFVFPVSGGSSDAGALDVVIPHY